MDRTGGPRHPAHRVVLPALRGPEVRRGTISKSARLVVALSLIGGVSLAVVIGRVTEFFGSIADAVASLWNDFMDWINSPLGWEHLLAGAGVLFVPVIVLVLIFAIADG
ncbi:hypothetical protein GCM10010306_091140 [Streptomyces umbrinus]|nr:hypothetical protein GCM10010306_091140 [Streptomyces umbrinus]